MGGEPGNKARGSFSLGPRLSCMGGEPGNKARGSFSLCPRPFFFSLCCFLCISVNKNQKMRGLRTRLGELTMAGCQLIESIRSPCLHLGGCGEVGEGLH